METMSSAAHQHQQQQQQSHAATMPVPALQLGRVHSQQQAGAAVGLGPSSSLLATAHSLPYTGASTAHAIPLYAGDTASAKQLLAEHTSQMGVFSTYTSQAAIAGALKRAAAQRHIDEVAAQLALLQGETEVLRAQLHQEARVCDAMRGDIGAMEHDLAHAVPTIAHPLERRTRGYALSQNIAAANKKLQMQDEVYQRTRKRFEAKDLETDACQYEMRQMDELAVLLKQQQEEENFSRALLSQASEQHNVALRLRQQRKQQRDEQATRDEDARQAAHDLADHVRAEEHRQRHAAELQEGAEMIREREVALNEMRLEALGRRKESVAQLKSSTEAAMNDMLASNARRAKQLGVREARRAQERTELLAAGRNPDAIFAARDEEARMANKARRIKAEQVVRGARLQVQMAAEVQMVVKEEVAEFKRKLVIDEYQRQMGHSVIDTQAAAMAHARQRRLDKKRNEEALLVRQLENERFIPDDVSEPDDEDDESGPVDSAAGGVALTNFQAASAAPASDSDDEFAGGSAPADLLSPSQLKAAFKSEYRMPGAEYNEWGLRVIPNHSDPYRARLDARKIALSLAAQKAKLAAGTTKVVCGRSSAHTSVWLSDPTEIVFKDFRVGEEMSQTISIVNAGHSFNHFRLLALADEYADFFEIVYQPVGRMGAGCTAKIKIIFRPKVNVDIRTVLPLLAETGPFSIPIICTTKKAVIAIEPDPILDMDVTVLGDDSTAYFTIHNHGALPVDFVVLPIQKQRTNEAQAAFEQQQRQRDGFEEKEFDHAGLTQSLSSITLASTDVTPLNFTGLLPAAPLQHALDDDESMDQPSASARLLDPSQIALPPNFHRSAEDDLLVSQANADLLAYTSDYLTYATTGRVEAYSSTRWTIRFKPVVDGAWAHSFQLRFGPQNYVRGQPVVQWGSPKEFDLQVVGEGTKVPVYIENDLLDLQTMCFGKLYRSEVVLHNRHALAHQIEMRLPPRLQALSEFIEFTPRNGYLQGHDILRVQVKVTPKKEMWRLLRKLTLTTSNGCINEDQYSIGHVYVPLSIDVAQQTLPVLWSLTARLVDPTLKLSVTSLDFGRVFTSESKALPIVFTNQSPILQKLSFVHLPEHIHIEPREGITLPPFRSMAVNVVFSPASSIEYDFSIEARTKLGETIRIPVRGVGKKPLLALQHTNIAFQSTPNFTQSYQANFVTNLSKKWKHTIEFIVDEPEETDAVASSIHSQRSFLRIFPRTIQIDPLPLVAAGATSTLPTSATSLKRTKVPKCTSKARVEIEFRPFLNLSELYANINAHQANGDEADDLAGELEEKEENDEFAASMKKATSAAPKRAAKKARLNAEQEAELAAKLAAEEELIRLEEERVQLEKEETEAAAARALAAAFEFDSREALEERERVLTKNDRPERNWMEFSDRLQLQIVQVEQARDDAQQRLDELAQQQLLLDDADDASIDGADEIEWALAGNAPLPAKVTVAEPFSRHARHRVAVHIKSENVTTGAISYDITFMEVQTTLVLPTLEAQPRSVDFGQLPLGKAVTKSFEVRNTSDTQTLQLIADTLGYSSNFSVLNALRVLQPGEIQIVVVEFKPRREGKNFKQDLILRSQENPNIQVTVPLLGLCISPNLQLILAPTDDSRSWPATNESLEMQQLHLGDCVINEHVTRTFTVKNLSAYPYAFRLTQHEVLDGGGAHANVHGATGTITTTTHNVSTGPAFYFTPAEGLIPADGGTAQVTIHFTPTAPTIFFPYQTILEVGNQRLKLVAEVHERQLFVQGGRQVLANDTQAHLAAPALQQQLQSSSFQNQSLVSGFTRIADLIYQDPLSFLDGPAVVSQSVGGGAIAAQYPSLTTEDAWDRVHLEDDDSAQPRVVEDKTKKGAKAKAKDGGEKESARGRAASAAGVSGSSEATVLAPTSIANRMVELTFDAKRVQWSSAASSSGKSRSSRDRGDASATQQQVLVEIMQIGSAAMASALGGDAAVSSKSAEKEASGGFEISFIAPSADASGDALPQLFSVEPTNGTLKPGAKEAIHFSFDYGRYQQIKAADAERRVLSVGQWLEGAARIHLKGGFTPAHVPHQQTIEVQLRVFVD